MMLSKENLELLQKMPSEEYEAVIDYAAIYFIENANTNKPLKSHEALKKQMSKFLPQLELARKHEMMIKTNDSVLELLFESLDEGFTEYSFAIIKNIVAKKEND